jgi:hypothetical protein
MYRPHPVIRPGAAQHIAIGSGHLESSALGANVVMLCATSDCHVVFGTTPTATASDTFLPAKIPVTFACLSTDQVSVIQDAGAGTLYITPGA